MLIVQNMMKHTHTHTHTHTLLFKNKQTTLTNELLLIKILHKKVSFKTSLESRERERERAMTNSERERILALYSREREGPTSMLFSSERGNGKSSLIRRRAQRPRRDISLEEVSKVLRGSASDNLIGEMTGLACSAWWDLRMSLTAEFCTCKSSLMIICG